MFVHHVSIFLVGLKIIEDVTEEQHKQYVQDLSGISTDNIAFVSAQDTFLVAEIQIQIVRLLLLYIVASA